MTGQAPSVNEDRGNSRANDPFLTVLKQMSAKDATAKAGRGRSHKIEKRIDNSHKRVSKENYDGVKDVNQL